METQELSQSRRAWPVPISLVVDDNQPLFVGSYSCVFARSLVSCWLPSLWFCRATTRTRTRNNIIPSQIIYHRL